MGDQVANKLENLINTLNAKKFSQTFRLESISTDSSILSLRLRSPIQLDKNLDYKVGLRYLSFYNQIVNIDNTNNIFKYSHNNGTDWTTLTINNGSWEITELDKEIKRMMKNRNHYDSANNSYYINIIPKPTINKIVFNITNANYQLDRNIENTITNYFGFNNNSLPLTNGYHIAENIMEIISVHTVDIWTNISDGSYTLNPYGYADTSGIIYDIPSMTVPIGYKVIEMPTNIDYFKLNTSVIHQIECRLLDQDGNLLNIPGERKFISLKIEQV